MTRVEEEVTLEREKRKVIWKREKGEVTVERDEVVTEEREGKVVRL